MRCRANSGKGLSIAKNAFDEVFTRETRGYG